MNKKDILQKINELTVEHEKREVFITLFKDLQSNNNFVNSLEVLELFNYNSKNPQRYFLNKDILYLIALYFGLKNEYSIREKYLFKLSLEEFTGYLPVILNYRQFRIIKKLLNKIALNLEDLKLLKFDSYKASYKFYNLKLAIDYLINNQLINFTNFYELVNYYRVKNGLSIDNSFLKKLLKEFNKKDLNSYYLIGLSNLLNDRNLIYNDIGTKINILSTLNEIKLSTLNRFKVDNYKLNDKFKHLVYKNNKIKFYTKLYFIKENDKFFIILSTLLHDNITNYVISNSNELDFQNYFYDFKKNKIDNSNLSIELIKINSNSSLDYKERKENQLRFLYLSVCNYKGYKITFDYLKGYSVDYILNNLNNKDNINILSLLNKLSDFRKLENFYLNLDVEDNTYLKLSTTIEDYQLYNYTKKERDLFYY